MQPLGENTTLALRESARSPGDRRVSVSQEAKPVEGFTGIDLREKVSASLHQSSADRRQQTTTLGESRVGPPRTGTRKRRTSCPGGSRCRDRPRVRRQRRGSTTRLVGPRSPRPFGLPAPPAPVDRHRERGVRPGQGCEESIRVVLEPESIVAGHCIRQNALTAHFTTSTPMIPGAFLLTFVSSWIRSHACPTHAAKGSQRIFAERPPYCQTMTQADRQVTPRDAAAAQAWSPQGITLLEGTCFPLTPLRPSGYGGSIPFRWRNAAPSLEGGKAGGSEEYCGSAASPGHRRAAPA